MTTIEWLCGAFMAVLMGSSALVHLFQPRLTDPFIPDFLPKPLAHWFAAMAELTLAIGIFIPPYRNLALQGTVLLMLLFLPLHIRDVVIKQPAIGSRIAAWIRLPIQFVFMAMAWYAMA